MLVLALKLNNRTFLFDIQVYPDFLEEINKAFRIPGGFFSTYYFERS